MSAQNIAVTKRFFDEVCNGRKLNLARDMYSTNHVHHDPAEPEAPTGPEGVMQVIATYQNAFNDALWTVHEMLASGDTVITRWTGTGTHTGNLKGIAPTGRQVSVTGLWMHRFQGGKIVETWSNWDALGLLQQLGAVPEMARKQAAARH